MNHIEYGEMGYLPIHVEEIPRDVIDADLAELSLALGVALPEVEWHSMWENR